MLVVVLLLLKMPILLLMMIMLRLVLILAGMDARHRDRHTKCASDIIPATSTTTVRRLWDNPPDRVWV